MFNILFQYFLLTGDLPFQEKAQIVEDDFVMPKTKNRIQNLLKALLEKDPENRIGSYELMAHRFFKNIEWNTVIEKKLKPSFIPIDQTVQFDHEII